ncbi:MAG: hypothetical protein WCC10_16715 [Tumebacillaceae bacterium]
MIRWLLVLASDVLGFLPFWLAAYAEDRAVNVFPLQVITAILAVVAGVLALRSDGAFLPKLLASLGLFAGAIWLVFMGLLYLIWPK